MQVHGQAGCGLCCASPPGQPQQHCAAELASGGLRTAQIYFVRVRAGGGGIWATAAGHGQGMGGGQSHAGNIGVCAAFIISSSVKTPSHYLLTCLPLVASQGRDCGDPRQATPRRLDPTSQGGRSVLLDITVSTAVFTHIALSTSALLARSRVVHAMLCSAFCAVSVSEIALL